MANQFLLFGSFVIFLLCSCRYPPEHAAHAWTTTTFVSRHTRHEKKTAFGITATRRRTRGSSSRSSLRMGLMDKFFSNFLQSREGDFVKLETSEQEFGPGPLLVLVGVPAGILDEEIADMIQDGAPAAHAKGCALFRMNDGIHDPSLAQITLRDALEGIASKTIRGQQQFTEQQRAATATTTSTTITTSSVADEATKTAVLLFSGFRDKEMMAVYNIMGQEIYQESAGQLSPACAKAVPAAMQKPFQQVLEEIAGDHREAMQMDE